MQEWLIWHAWKACVPQKGTGGSNPPLSAFLSIGCIDLRVNNAKINAAIFPNILA